MWTIAELPQYDMMLSQRLRVYSCTHTFAQLHSVQCPMHLPPPVNIVTSGPLLNIVPPRLSKSITCEHSGTGEYKDGFILLEDFLFLFR